MKCAACGDDTPRLRLTQRYCPSCERRITEQIRRDTERRTPRWNTGKDLTGATR